MRVVIHRSISTASRSPPSVKTRHLRRVAVVDEGIPFAVGCGVALVGLSAAYAISDPQKRRDDQILQTGGTEKDSVKDYFNGDGFERWKRIYGTTEEVNDVQRDIRDGHAVTIDKVLNLLTTDKRAKT